jgi:hypothetical protein
MKAGAEMCELSELSPRDAVESLSVKSFSDAANDLARLPISPLFHQDDQDDQIN